MKVFEENKGWRVIGWEVESGDEIWGRDKERIGNG